MAGPGPASGGAHRSRLGRVRPVWPPARWRVPTQTRLTPLPTPEMAVVHRVVMEVLPFDGRSLDMSMSKKPNPGVAILRRVNPNLDRTLP